jgi:CHASE2 domain-containing sensor protein
VRWRRPRSKLGWILIAALLLMFPACWVVFVTGHLQPMAGYFLWTGAMLLVLFAKATEPRGDLLIARDRVAGEI